MNHIVYKPYKKTDLDLDSYIEICHPNFPKSAKDLKEVTTDLLAGDNTTEDIISGDQ